MPYRLPVQTIRRADCHLPKKLPDAIVDCQHLAAYRGNWRPRLEAEEGCRVGARTGQSDLLRTWRVTVSADDILVFAGSGSPKLTLAICAYLNIKPALGEVLRFSEGNLFVRVKENVRGRRTYVVQSTVYPTNDNFMELLFWIDALKRASAESVTVVMPYFSYGKGDKKDEPRVSIRARVCADAIEAAGADRVVTLDLHAPQIQGFFSIPVDDLYALPVLGEAVKKKQVGDLVVVSPDTGFVKQARRFATYLVDRNL